MSQPLPNVTDAEWSVLQMLWERGPETVRRLTDVLYPRGGPSEYATVHKLLERLEAKGYVRRKRHEGLFVFEAAVDRDEVIGQQLEALVAKECGGSLQALLSNLIRVKRLKAGELRELLDLVDQLDIRSKGKRERS